jgi:hypothetical protein
VQWAPIWWTGYSWQRRLQPDRPHHEKKFYFISLARHDQAKAHLPKPCWPYWARRWPRKFHFPCSWPSAPATAKILTLPRFKPCSFVAASESNTYERFNEAKIKALTGGGNEVYCAFKQTQSF